MVPRELLTRVLEINDPRGMMIVNASNMLSNKSFRVLGDSSSVGKEGRVVLSLSISQR